MARLKALLAKNLFLFSQNKLSSKFSYQPKKHDISVQKLGFLFFKLELKNVK